MDKRLIRFLSKILIVAMLLTNNSTYIFADSINNNEVLDEQLVKNDEYIQNEYERIDDEVENNTNDEDNAEHVQEEIVEDAEYVDEEIIAEDAENEHEENVEEDAADGEEVDTEVIVEPACDFDIDDEEKIEEEPEEDINKLAIAEVEPVITEEIVTDENKVESLFGNDDMYYELKQMLLSHGITEWTEDTLMELYWYDLSEDADGTLIATNEYGKRYIVTNEYMLRNPWMNDLHSVTLDFDKGPTFDKAANTTAWSDEAIEKFTTNNTKRTITGESYSEIISAFASTTFPQKTRGGVAHVELPIFADDVWPGFSFAGWFDITDVNVVIQEDNTFPRAFPNSDLLYTAKWERVQNEQKIYINFYKESSGVKHQIKNQVTITSYHGQYLNTIIDTAPGLKISEVKIKKENTDESETGSQFLKTLNAYGNYITYSEEEGDMQIIVSGDDYSIDGYMPNHDIYLDVYFAGTDNDKPVFKVDYVDLNGEDIQESDIQNVVVDTVIEKTPPNISGDGFSYSYDHATISVAYTSDDLSTGIYKLGKWQCDGQILTPTDKNDTSANKGKFKAYMPNQDITLTYYYNLTSAVGKVDILTKTENDDGTYNESVVTNSSIPLGSENMQQITILNKENQGYGAPVISFLGSSLMNGPYNYTGGIGGPNGTLQYYVTGVILSTISIIYPINHNSEYWCKLSYNAIEQAQGGKGTIEAAPNSKPLNDRFIARGTYNIGDLTQGIVVTPDTNYMCVWYMNKTSGIGEVGNPLNTGIDLTERGTFTLFAKFVEDPSCFVDIHFDSTDNCSISGTRDFHLAKGSLASSITPPTVTPAQGYTNSGWICATSSEPYPEAFEESRTYIPLIESSFTGSTSPVKPIAKLTIGSDGRGTIKTYGSYQNRKYVLTDKNKKVKEIKEGSASVNTGFSGLLPGTSYKLYEVMEGAPNITIGNVIPNDTAHISDPYEFGVNAITNNYAVNTTGENFSINVTPKAGITYALLDDRYNIKSNWTTSPNFTGLTNGTYYVVVAKGTSDSGAATDDDVINNGVVVSTEYNEPSDGKYKLTIFGSDAIMTNGATLTPTTGTGDDQVKVYNVDYNETVSLIGGGGKRWELISGPSDFNPDLSSSQPSFNMPKSDVVLRNYTPIPAASKYDIVVNSENKIISLYNRIALGAYLNTDTIAQTAINSFCDYKYYVNIVENPTKKSIVQGLNTGQIAPNEYSIEIIMVVQGKPVLNGKISDAGASGKLKVNIALIGTMKANSDFALSSGDISKIYNMTNDYDIGSLSFNLNSSNAISLKCNKLHKINITQKNDGVATTYDKNFYVKHNSALNTASNFQNDFVKAFDSQNNTGDMRTYFDHSLSTATSHFNSVEYVYQGLSNSTTVNQSIIRNTNIFMSFTKNNNRETIKNNLNNKISDANAKYNTLTNETVKATFLASISTATNIKEHQDNYTVQQIQAALNQLIIDIENAVDPLPPPDPSQTIIVTLDGNGGTLNVSSIEAIKNQYFDALSNVTGTRSGYTLQSFNTEANGSGETITSNTIVDETAYPTILYAMWHQNAQPSPSYGGGGGGGGGGGTGRSITPGLGDEILVDPLTGTIMASKQMGFTINGNGFTNTVLYKDSQEYNTLYIYDPINNVFNLCLENATSGERLTNQWATRLDDKNNYEPYYYTYNFDENGWARTGFYTEGNEVYYFSRLGGDKYATLQTGWVYEPFLKTYYYFSPLTGAMATGWQNIDGKDYYFKADKMLDILGNLYINNDTAVVGYGQMLSNCYTPDGYLLDKDGARVVERPE